MPATTEMAKTRITVLVENTAGGPGLLAEHGLAYWIEHDGRHVLLDSGQGGVLASNAYKLGIALREIDALVLSHGHYDHTGGVAEALKTNRPVTVYAHPAAFARKYIRNSDGTAREIGMPYPSDKAIRDSRNRLIATDQPTTVFDGLTVTGPVPRLTDFEDTGGPFFLDEACTQAGPVGRRSIGFLRHNRRNRRALGLRTFGRHQHPALHPPVDRQPSHPRRHRRDAPGRCFSTSD